MHQNTIDRYITSPGEPPAKRRAKLRDEPEGRGGGGGEGSSCPVATKLSKSPPSTFAGVATPAWASSLGTTTSSGAFETNNRRLCIDIQSSRPEVLSKVATLLKNFHQRLTMNVSRGGVEVRELSPDMGVMTVLRLPSVGFDRFIYDDGGDMPEVARLTMDTETLSTTLGGPPIECVRFKQYYDSQDYLWVECLRERGGSHPSGGADPQGSSSGVGGGGGGGGGHRTGRSSRRSASRPVNQMIRLLRLPEYIYPCLPPWVPDVGVVLDQRVAQEMHRRLRHWQKISNSEASLTVEVGDSHDVTVKVEVMSVRGDVFSSPHPAAPCVDVRIGAFEPQGEEVIGGGLDIERECLGDPSCADDPNDPSAAPRETFHVKPLEMPEPGCVFGPQRFPIRVLSFITRGHSVGSGMAFLFKKDKPVGVVFQLEGCGWSLTYLPTIKTGVVPEGGDLPEDPDVCAEDNAGRPSPPSIGAFPDGKGGGKGKGKGDGEGDGEEESDEGGDDVDGDDDDDGDDKSGSGGGGGGESDASSVRDGWDEEGSFGGGGDDEVEMEGICVDEGDDDDEGVGGEDGDYGGGGSDWDGDGDGDGDGGMGGDDDGGW